jgi:hypothetical protein
VEASAELYHILHRCGDMEGLTADWTPQLRAVVRRMSVHLPPLAHDAAPQIIGRWHV